MKALIGITAGAVLIASVALAQQPPKEITLKTMPPSVVRTVLRAGDTAVDPALKQIAVTFSKDMKTNRMWAVCQISKETFPETAGPIQNLRYAAAGTQLLAFSGQSGALQALLNRPAHS